MNIKTAPRKGRFFYYLPFAMEMKKFRTVDEYIDSLPEHSATRILQIRNAVRQVAKNAEENISYNMPAFFQNGNLVYYAAFKNHVSIFPHPAAIEEFNKELKGFETSKGTIKFPNDQKLPITLIKKIVAFRVKENLAKAKAKTKK